MKNEDYVSPKVAKGLKEKGFKEPCNYFYREGGSCDGSPWEVDYNKYPGRYSRPTLYDAQKWLRETHNIDVLPVIRQESLPKKDYCCYIYKNTKVVRCKVAYGEDFYECMNDGLLEALKLI